LDHGLDTGGPRPGGRVLSQWLLNLREALENYFGYLNEIASGLHPTEIPDKPNALIRYSQRKEMGIPYIDGGLLDQPYIWVQEDGVISSFLKEWKAAPTKSKDDEWLMSPDDLP
jgi:hypothetical protein